MMKNIVRKLGTYKKSFKDSLGKEKKEGNEIKEQTLVIEDPAQVLEEENQQEESSEEVINIDGEEITQSLDFLYTSLKKLLGSNKQLSSVGKHLSKQITDTAIEKQLIAGYESLNLWSETLNTAIKKLVPPATPTSPTSPTSATLPTSPPSGAITTSPTSTTPPLPTSPSSSSIPTSPPSSTTPPFTSASPPIKIWTIRKLLKICKYTAQSTTVLLVAIKSVAAFDSENADVQKQVAMSTRTVRDAVYQLLCAWESFPTTVIPDLDVVNHIGNTSKQIISMCDNVEAAAGPTKSIVALSSTRMELIAACRAAAAATTRLIYAHTGEKYKSITPATTTLKVILSTITQVLAVTANINSILFKQDEATPLKILLASAAQTLKRAADKLEESGKDPSLVRSKIASIEALTEEPSRLSVRSVSAPVVSIAATILAKPPRAFTTTPTMVSRSATPTSPQHQPLYSHELYDALQEIQAIIEKQAANPPVPEPSSTIRKISGSADEIPTAGYNTPPLNSSTNSAPTNPTSPLSLSNDAVNTTTANGTSTSTSSPTLTSTPAKSPSPPPTENHGTNSNPSSRSSSFTDPSSSNTQTESTSTEDATPDTKPDAKDTNQETTINSNPSIPPVLPTLPALPTTPSKDPTFENFKPSPIVNSLSRSAPNIPTNRKSSRDDTQDATPIHQSGSFPISSPATPTSPTPPPQTQEWTKVDSSSFRSPRASVRMPRGENINTGNPPLPSSSLFTLPSSSVSPPTSPLSTSAPSQSPISPPTQRKPSKKADDMTLAKLFTLIPGNKDDQRTPHAGKKLLKVLVALIAAYNSAIDVALAEIKEMAARTDLVRSPSQLNIAGDSRAVHISTQGLTDALGQLEAGIPAPPLTPPAHPIPPSPQQSERRSGDMEVDIWSEPPDEEGVNVMFHESGKIRAGTLNKLVERLTSPTHADLKFMKTFITTYRSFCDPEILLHKIMQRFEVPEAESANELPIQLRVCNVLRQWVEYQFFDFDKQLLETLVTFIDTKLINHKSYKAFATSILNTIQAKQTDSGMRVISNDLRNDSKGIQLTPSRLLFVFDEEEIAKQLTLIDFSIYSAIQPVELLNLAWSNPKYRHRSPHVIALIARANLLSNWVASVILWQPRKKDRVKIMAKLISIAKHLQNLNNFNSLVSVLAGLNKASIHRLRVSRGDLPKQSQETFRELEEVMNVNSAYKTYRGLLHNVNPPCIPFLGVYLTDLTFVEEGNPDFIKNLINFGKRELVYNVLAEIQQYQLAPYVFPLVDNIASFLDQLPHIQGDSDMHCLSLLREPRDATRESVV